LTLVIIGPSFARDECHLRNNLPIVDSLRGSLLEMTAGSRPEVTGFMRRSRGGLAVGRWCPDGLICNRLGCSGRISKFRQNHIIVMAVCYIELLPVFLHKQALAERLVSRRTRPSFLPLSNLFWLSRYICLLPSTENDALACWHVVIE